MRPIRLHWNSDKDHLLGEGRGRGCILVSFDPSKLANVQKDPTAAAAAKTTVVKRKNAATCTERVTQMTGGKSLGKAPGSQCVTWLEY